MCFFQVFRRAFVAIEKSLESLAARRRRCGRLQRRSLQIFYLVPFCFCFCFFRIFLYFDGLHLLRGTRRGILLMIHRHRFFLLYTRGFDELFRLLLLLCLLIALIEAYIALFFRILFLHFVQLGFAGLEALKLKAEDIANECLHVDFHLKQRHLETFWGQICQRMLDNFDRRRLKGFLSQDAS